MSGGYLKNGESVGGGGMANPMTTAGDLIRGGTAGAPERVAVGTTGQVLTVAAGVPGWADPAGPPAVPTTSLVLDLDADAGVTLVSGGVSAWTSQTTGAFVAAQATPGARPTVVPWGYGDHDAIRFDGVDDFLLIPHDAALDLATLTVYVVCRVPETDTAGTVTAGTIFGRSIDGVEGGNFAVWSLRATGTGSLSARLNGESASAGSTAYDWRVPSIWSLSIGAASSAVRKQGQAVASATATSATYSSPQPVSIGALFYAASTAFGSSDIARILIYSGQHTAAQAAEVYAALSERYGLPVCAGRTVAA